jgi:hypothetical protein
MRFKSPGGDLVWLSPLWLISGAVMTVLYARQGSYVFAVLMALLAVCAVLIWLDVRWVAKPLIMYFGLAVVGGAIKLFVAGFSWALLGRVALCVYAIRALWLWGSAPGAPTTSDTWRPAEDE